MVMRPFLLKLLWNCRLSSPNSSVKSKLKSKEPFLLALAVFLTLCRVPGVLIVDLIFSVIL